MEVAIPMHGRELTTSFISDLVEEQRPGVTVKSAEVVAVKSYGEADNESSVSTSSQVKIAVEYAGQGHEDLPRNLLAKLSFSDTVECPNPELDVWFENEVFFYNRTRRELDIETPIGMGGRFDQRSKRFILLMGDLNPRKPHINTMMDRDSKPAVQAVLAQLAKLHAQYWLTPRFNSDLSWVQNQVDGELETLFDNSVRRHIKGELANEAFKREFVEETGYSEDELYAAMKAVKRHQAKLQQTYLHGDAHFGNSYMVGESGGLLDWQASARGYLMHDVGYLIQSGLSVEDRRKYERELLQSYREELMSHGITDAPDMETLWLEYRRSMIYGFHMGWLTAPRANYGWEVMVLGNHRTKAACIDHESMKLVRDLL